MGKDNVLILGRVLQKQPRKAILGDLRKLGVIVKPVPGAEICADVMVTESVQKTKTAVGIPAGEIWRAEIGGDPAEDISKSYLVVDDLGDLFVRS